MRAVRFTAPGEIEITTVPDPTPADREVVLRVGASGICGTDLHILHGDHNPSFPIVPGHEFAGEVVAVGRGVTWLSVGDRVAADPNIPCRRCAYCQAGRVNLCDDYSAVGVTRDGAAAEFVAVPAELCVLLPEAVSLEHAALVEPLSCAVHAVDMLRARMGSRVAVYGAGTMGLMMLQLALNSGAASVDVVDLNDMKLAAAQALGARSTATAGEFIDEGRGWDVVIDATGSAAAIADGIARTGKGGTFLQFGVAKPEATVSISPHRIYEDEITIVGSVCPENAFGRAAAILAEGRLDVEALISDRIALADYATAIERFAAGDSKKILVLP